MYITIKHVPIAKQWQQMPVDKTTEMNGPPSTSF